MKKFFTGLILALLLLNYSISVFASETNQSSDCIYLSDIDYDSGSNVGYGSITLDKNIENGSISLILDEGNSAVSFEKGVAAHATSTLIYDISSYNKEYDYFVTYAGVNSTKGSNGDGVKFYIYTSTDKVTWTLQTDKNPDILKGTDKAAYYKIDIKNVKYIKLYAHQNGNNSYDHAVYADAKLVKEGFDSESSSNFKLKSVEEYDKIIKAHTSKNGELDSAYELTLLQREFVNNIGYSTLKHFSNASSDNATVLNWLVNDKENLSYYLIGGKPDGSYYDSLTTMVRLYKAYADDMKDTTKTQYGNDTRGNLYKRMIITLSLTHSTTCGLWAGGKTGNISDPNDSDAVVRYQIYKKMYEAGKLDNDIFETRTIEEMRFVMNAIIDDESIEWLRDYSYNYDSTAKRNPYTYITYMSGYNYSKEEYYSEENYEKWDAKYKLKEYGITYKAGYPKMWIVFEENGVCGAIAKTGTLLQNVYGVPATVVGQPGHAAYIYQSLNSDGRTVWNLYNDVSGWANSGRTEKLGVRMLNAWGEYNVATYTTTIKPDTYIFLAQEALDDYSSYEKSEKILMLANVYSTDVDMLEKIYRNALEAESINFDALYGLVNLYVNNERSESDCYELAQQIAKTYTYHPLPMYDLLRILRNGISSAEYKVKFDLLQEKTLNIAKTATASDSVQYSGVRAIANALLGNVDTSVATFSFDGDNAGKIVLAQKYQGNGTAWEYSLDGGANYVQVNEDYVELSEVQIESINTSDGIWVHIVGVDYSDANIYRIGITKASTPSKLYANDMENSVIGADNTMEWKLEDSDSWTSFADKSPDEDLKDEATVYVRYKASGTKMASDSVTCNFTKDNQTAEKTYISISHLSLASVSSQQTGNDNYAKYAIDGNINTIWHTAWNGSDSERYIVIKLDEAKYLSAIEYVPRQDASNGRAKNATIYVSNDGENWEEVGSGSNWSNNATWKTITLDDSVKAQYVKFVVTQNYGDGRTFASAAMINLYEDTTKNNDEDDKKTETETETKTETETPDDDGKPEDSESTGNNGTSDTDNNITEDTEKPDTDNANGDSENPDSNNKDESNNTTDSTNKVESITPTESTTTQVSTTVEKDTTDSTIVSESELVNATTGGQMTSWDVGPVATITPADTTASATTDKSEIHTTTSSTTTEEVNEVIESTDVSDITDIGGNNDNNGSTLNTDDTSTSTLPFEVIEEEEPEEATITATISTPIKVVGGVTSGIAIIFVIIRILLLLI